MSDITIIDQRTVDFEGDEITAVQAEDGTIYIPIRPLCESLGLNWSGQRQRIQRDAVLSDAFISVVVTHSDIGEASRRPKRSTMLCLPLKYLNGWLFGVNAARVNDDVRPRLIAYQRECYDVLATAFQSPTIPESRAVGRLQNIREMGLAIAKMAEEQIAHERRIAHNEQRLTQAAYVVSDMQKRLTAVEQTIRPGTHITDEQAAEVKELVKAVAMSQGGNFQAVYGELYRRFNVSSYKLIPQRKYQQVIEFLQEWGGGN